MIKKLWVILIVILFSSCYTRYTRETKIVDRIIYTTIWDDDGFAKKTLYQWRDTIFYGTAADIKQHQNTADSLVKELTKIENNK